MDKLWGRHGDYLWLQSPPDGFDAVRDCCPELLRGKYVVVTSFDSGPLLLGEPDVAAGWTSRGELAFSPRLAPMQELPYDQFDEWYVFADPNDFGDEYEVFVNYARFTLKEPTYGADSSPHGHYGLHDLPRRFWTQMGHLAPESYLAVDGRFIFVSRDRRAYSRVEECIGFTTSI